ncbi:hypothetical protein ACOZ4I_05760 [Haloarcula salina]|uniref:hypothetical protein n=1 Tax=Haloarcula salina TaxID=1429914 RepID=UPI003C6FC4A4
MSAVGLTDVYRYGTKFLGALLVVAGVGGGLVAAGYVLIQNGSLDALSGNAGYRALLGVVVGALGCLLLVSGLIGLFHKLVADATMAGAVAARATRPDTVSAATGEAESDSAPPAPATGPETDSERSDEGDETEPRTEPVAAESEPNTAENDEEPVSDPSAGEVHSDPPAEAGAEPEPENSPAVSEPEPATESAPAASEPAAAETRAAAADAGPASADDQSASAVPSADVTPDTDTAATAVDDGATPDAEPDAAPSAAGVATESETASPEQSDAGDVPDRDLLDQDPPEEEQPRTEPQEWTPPDPAEFDTPDDEAADESGWVTGDEGGSSTADAGRDAPAADGDATPPASDAPSDSDPAQTADSGSRWDGADESADESHEDVTARETRVLDESSDQHGPRTTDDLFGGDSTDRTNDSAAESDPRNAPEGEPADWTEPGRTNDSRSELRDVPTDAGVESAEEEVEASGDEDGAETLADEDVSGFDVASDDDPLSDALDDK